MLIKYIKKIISNLLPKNIIKKKKIEKKNSQSDDIYPLF